VVVSLGFASPHADVQLILGDVHPRVNSSRRHRVQKLSLLLPFRLARPCGFGLPSCVLVGGPGNCSGSLLEKEGTTTFRLPHGLLFWWTRAGVGLSRPPGRFYDRKQDTRAGVSLLRPGESSQLCRPATTVRERARVAASRPGYRIPPTPRLSCLLRCDAW
jgi:hypothetical protein